MDSLLEELLEQHRWVLWCFVGIAGVVAYLAYVLGFMDFHWFVFSPEFNVFLTVLFKWIVTPIMSLGGLVVLTLLCLSEKGRHENHRISDKH